MFEVVSLNWLSVEDVIGRCPVEDDEDVVD
jgi:hypothetical protein